MSEQGQLPFEGDERRETPVPTDQEDRRRGLTEFQHNVVVTAGAGTGKTSLLVGRLISAMVRHHMEPSSVLAVTFTELAAAEMEERLVRMLEAVRPWLDGSPKVEESDAAVLELLDLGPEDQRRVDEVLEERDNWQITTFHGFCLGFLQQHARHLDLPPELRPHEELGSHDRFESTFLDYLEETTQETAPEALTLFEPVDLRDLARKMLDLPEQSFEKVRVSLPWPNLEESRAELQALVDTYPGARANWRGKAKEALAAYDAVLAGRRPEPPEGNSPKGGKKELGEEVSERLSEELGRHVKLLRTAQGARDEDVAVAVSYLAPFVQRFRRITAVHGDVSFQDLMLLTRTALMTDAALRQRVNKELAAILVDEFQDTDPLQYDIVFLLGAEPVDEELADPMQLQLRTALFIVGDAKQSIYRFRRADIAAFRNAMERLAAQGAVQLSLTANFRSDPPILELVNRVCERSMVENQPYQFAFEPVVPMLERPDQLPVRVVQIQNDYELSVTERRRREGRLVVEQIRTLQEEGTALGRIAILLRARTDTDWLMRPLRQAGIPHALEGSRRFYQRHEVLIAIALLTAVARPHDVTAVLAVLRSALSNATDADILRWSRERALDYSQSTNGGGTVGDTLQFLAEMRDSVLDLHVQDAIQTILYSDALLLATCSGFERAQCMANLERFQMQLQEQEFSDLDSVVRFLDRRRRLETDDEESSLFEEDQEVVRILTVHGAKGLEFDAVILPDLARRKWFDSRGDVTSVERLFDIHGKELLAVRIGSMQNLYSASSSSVAEQHRDAETRRLFYVAATRARRRLVMICGDDACNTEQHPWQHDLVSAELDGLDVQRARGLDSVEAETVTRIDRNAALNAFERHREAVSRARTANQLQEIAPSTQSEPTGTHGGTGLGARDEALRIGIAMHSYLALVDLEQTAPDIELLETVATEHACSEAPSISQLRDMAGSFHSSDVRQRLTRVTRLHREVPLSFRDGEELVNGVIDVLFEDADGSIGILDWKTDRVPAGGHETAAEHYQEQLGSYARGISHALQRSGTPTRLVHFLRSDLTVQLI